MKTKTLTIKEVSRIMGKSEMFVRIGLQRNILPFGTAQILPNRSRYSYYISPKLFYDFVGLETEQK